jgi:hypothetical protein
MVPQSPGVSTPADRSSIQRTNDLQGPDIENQLESVSRSARGNNQARQVANPGKAFLQIKGPVSGSPGSTRRGFEFAATTSL